MWSVSLKMMRRDGRMLIPAGIAIMVGTLFIAATFLFGNTLDYSVRNQVSSNFGGANYAVIADEGLLDKNVTVTTKDFHLDKIRSLPGVKGVRADADIFMEVSNSKANKHTNVQGLAMAKPTSLMPVPLVEGRWPNNNSEMILPKNAAERLDLKIGDQVKLAQPMGSQPEEGEGQAAGQAISLRLVGLNEDKNGAFSYYGGAAVMSEGAMARLNGEPASQGLNNLPMYTVYLLIDDAQAGQSTLDTIRKGLPKDFHLQTKAAYEEEQMKELSGQTNIMTTFLLSFGALAMFVAALVIANTFQVMVARQRRTLALLRTIGAKKGQVRSSVLTQSSILGLVASALGTLLAIGLMAVLQATKLQLGGLSLVMKITPVVILVPLLFGTAITMLASLGSASAATRVAPLEALRPPEVAQSKRSGLVRLLISCLLMLLGTAMAAYVLNQAVQDARGVKHTMIANDSSMALAIAVAGVALVFLGVLLSAVRWLPWLLKGIGALVAHIGPSSRVAVGNISRNPKRVAATGTALLIGVTLVSCLGTGAASAKETLTATLDSQFSLDVEIVPGQSDQASLKESLHKIRQVKGVGAAELIPVYYAELVSDQGTPEEAAKKAQASKMEDDGFEHRESGNDIAIYSLKPGQAKQLMNVDIEHSLTGGAKLLMPQQIMSKHAYLKNGQTVHVTANISESKNKIERYDFKLGSGDFKGLSASMPQYAVALDNQISPMGKPDSYEIWVKADGSQSVGTFMDDIRESVSQAEGTSATGAIAMKDSYEQIINIFLMIMVALLAVAVIIALIGVANTLSLSVIERTRESATLRAIGMTRQQLRRSLAVEALLICLASSLAGLLLGTLFGWTGSYIVFESIGHVSLPVNWGMDGLIILVAVLAALLASVLPARRATKTAPVEALAEA